ncbi:hypothetical protein FI667_g9263, partial [Globisporangium splendens]
MVFSKFAPLVALAVASVAGTDAALARVDAGVHRTLRQQGTVNLIVTMKKGTDESLASIQESSFPTRGQKIASLVESLESNSKSSQEQVTALLTQESGTAGSSFSGYESFWISNQIYIKDATFELVEKLAALDSIYELAEEEIYELPPVIQAAASNFSVLANEWGVSKVQAPEVWAKGYNGQNVVVSTIDSGVLGTHTALSGNFRSNYGWYDPERRTAAPYDVSGHGTHTMGTIAGTGGIGVAPAAQWIACKGCRTTGCPQSDLLTCAQFITCPTTTTGTNRDCTKAPDLVSNSWGGGQGSTAFASSVNAWRTAGIIPIFANGNAGPACRTANSPGDLSTVIAVGATDVNDALASFSSKGPSVGGLLKPEISGPGVSVRSAWYTGTSAYNSISGTSMATPHVAGVVALLLSYKPTLTYAQVRTALTTTTDKATLKSTGYTCGSTADATFPNNQYGYGRVNALNAFNAV